MSTRRSFCHVASSVPVASIEPRVLTVSWDCGTVKRSKSAVARNHSFAVDIHCHMLVPESSPLQVGDMVSFGVSHPCLTFDKWRVLFVVDDDYDVVAAVETFF